jgi:1-deoxy-D-xylulose 5-phosphate reductoisomerase
MARIVEATMERLSPFPECASLEAVFAVDAEARRIAEGLIAAR